VEFVHHSRRKSCRARRIPLVIAASFVGLCVLIVVAVFAPRLAAGLSIGQAFEEMQGQTHTTHFADSRDAPAGDIPAWFPANATSITLEVPGPHSKSPGGVQLDAVVGADFALPPECTPTGQSFPWAGGWNGLNIPAASLLKCGSWTATVSRSHLYAWKY
jgi:hypothetical protein